MSSPRYVVGIDLGTTHTALAYAEIPTDPSAPPPAIQMLAIPQLVAQGSVEPRELLPSFFYIAHESEGAQALPWDAERKYAVGEHARARGVDAPARVIASAKSWLGHPSVDRRGAILPSGAPEDVERISPVEASWRYLEHLVEAWNHVVAKGDPELALGKQSVVLTVPASFDASARELTTEAAFAAGLEDLTLLEEPQAAFYSWLSSKGDGWRKDVAVGDIVLVVDVGGGTTDFSVIAALEKEGELVLERVAVGDHILLGGDNMDMLLAYVVEHKMIAEAEAGGRTLELDRWQKISLQHAARGAKERLLADSGAASAPIAIAGKGSKLVGSTLRAEVTREEVANAIVDGFFPVVESAARPAVRARAALTTLGLPYAQDPAVTKHLASLLARHVDALEKAGVSSARKTKMLHPTRILFNGGVMKSGVLRERLTSCVNAWLGEDEGAPLKMLEGNDLDLAVARGAAAYGLSRHGRGVRIRGGTARAYYVGIEGAVPAVPGLPPPITALCVAPFGMEEGTSAEVPGGELGVVVGEKVNFRFFGSSVRRKDSVGVALERWKSDELDELPQIQVDLPAEGRAEGDVVPVKLRSSITEVGTLLLEAVPLDPKTTDERWKVELSVRSS
ncbi:DnaK-related protein [Labilithrix luteola]|uniref:DnaK-related protein n=1 Tax=Labilithrix luteola TaxID=1391654 RepID=A0A0K1PIY4_9BACT|nr:Hsp70 family protein [Labilithrix luteola]AKU93482.1 DnaK-related protein [Labilithrix luteola]